MSSNARALIDRTIENLEALTVVLGEEIRERTRHASVLTPEARTYKEARLTISVLLPKLNAARAMETRYEEPPPRHGCANCDDS